MVTRAPGQLLDPLQADEVGEQRLAPGDVHPEEPGAALPGARLLDRERGREEHRLRREEPPAPDAVGTADALDQVVELGHLAAVERDAIAPEIRLLLPAPAGELRVDLDQHPPHGSGVRDAHVDLAVAGGRAILQRRRAGGEPAVERDRREDVEEGGLALSYVAGDSDEARERGEVDGYLAGEGGQAANARGEDVHGDSR